MSDDRSFWDDYDRRRADESYDHRVDELAIIEARRRAIEAIRRGDTAGAIAEEVGPDAAIDYLVRTGVGREPRPWPPYPAARTFAEFVENVETLPPNFEIRASQVLESSVATYVVMEAIDAQAAVQGDFWARESIDNEWLLAGLQPTRIAAAVRAFTRTLQRHRFRKLGILKDPGE